MRAVTLHQLIVTYPRRLGDDGVKVKELAEHTHCEERAEEWCSMGSEVRADGILNLQCPHLLQTLYEDNSKIMRPKGWSPIEELHVSSKGGYFTAQNKLQSKPKCPLVKRKYFRHACTLLVKSQKSKFSWKLAIKYHIRKKSLYSNHFAIR